jgi:hypothetical protein
MAIKTMSFAIRHLQLWLVVNQVHDPATATVLRQRLESTCVHCLNLALFDAGQLSVDHRMANWDESARMAVLQAPESPFSQGMQRVVTQLEVALQLVSFPIDQARIAG